MIPQILELKNFLSYGEPIQRIDFKDHGLICLSGKNGHGKSALLDAITWAIWGQARKITGAAKADEGLLRLGQTRMMVSLEFIFSGKTYRVRREFGKTYGKPHAALDFEVFDEASDRFISLTDKTIRATQAKIEQLIGLDYETFINTAFLRQGQSNEFSKKSAKERKQILATILGLSKYDRLQQVALDKVRKLNDEKRAISAVSEQYANDLNNEPTLIQNLANNKEQLATVNQQLEVTYKTVIEHEKALTNCRAHKQTLAALQQDLRTKEESYHESITLLKQRINEWRHIHAQGLHLPNVQALHDDKKRLLVEEQTLRKAQQKNIELQEKILNLKDLCLKRTAALKNSLDQSLQQQRLAVQHHEFVQQSNQAKLAQNQQQQKDLSNKITVLNHDIKTYAATREQQRTFEPLFAKTKNQFDKRRTFYQTLIQRGNWVKNELDELDRKQKVIHDTSNPACPLCEQLLTAKRKQFLSQQFVQTESFLRHRFQRLSTLIKRLKDLLVVQHESVQQLSQQAESFTQKNATFQEKNLQLQELNTTLQALSQEQQALEAEIKAQADRVLQAHKILQEQETLVLQQSNNDPELVALAQQQEALEAEKKGLVFDAAAYAAVQERINQLDALITNHQSIQQAQLLQHERKKAVGIHIQEIKKIKKSVADLVQQQQQYAAVLEQEQQLTKQVVGIQETIRTMVTQKEHLFHTIGSLEFEHKRLQTIKKELEKKQQHVKTLDQEIEDYQALAIALSKNGIQALLIEEAIPEIEQEANTILARLTDNQAQIFIESLRDLKSGGVRETLDIQIADAAGIRPYEMYSGGEAFRVDFALRIAIAKLLARRAGTALQTLIIDEGFGSQDEEGLAHIMDCLHAIQDDFSKIIIVSHLQDFKHNFPVHFVIEKGPTGSMVHVQERG